MKYGLLIAAIVFLVVILTAWPPRPPAPGAIVIEPFGNGQRVVLDVAGRRSVLATLDSTEGMRNVTWSPGNKCVAFESYNLEGHSPMTTTRTWVGSASGQLAAAVRLPANQERFSTFIEQWDDPYTLVVHATVLEPAQDLSYRYDCRNGQLEGPIWR